MATLTPTAEPRPATFVGLTAEVAGAAKDLVAAHGAQFRSEVRTEITRAVANTERLGAGGGMLGIGVVFLLIAGIQMLQEWYGLTATAAWGSVGAVVALVGLTIAWIAHRQLHTINLVPDRSLQSFRESLSWISQR